MLSFFLMTLSFIIICVLSYAIHRLRRDNKTMRRRLNTEIDLNNKYRKIIVGQSNVKDKNSYPLRSK